MQTFTEDEMIYFAQYCEAKGYKPNIHSLKLWQEESLLQIEIEHKWLADVANGR